MRLRTWLPYLLLVPPAVAVLLTADRFPDPMPIHWGADGVANGFVPHSTGWLVAPLLFLGGVLFFVDAVIALGSRAGPPAMTDAVRRNLEPIRWMLALAGFPLAFASLWGPVPVLVWAGSLVLVVIVQAVRSLRMAPGPVAGWKGGLIYANPADPRLLVPKRSGLGWTFNFAKPSAWMLLVLLLAGPLLAVFLIGQQIEHGRTLHSASGASRVP